MRFFIASFFLALVVGCVTPAPVTMDDATRPKGPLIDQIDNSISAQEARLAKVKQIKLLAELAGLVYLGPDYVKSGMQRFGIQAYEFLWKDWSLWKDKSLSVYLFYTETDLIVAFRGSDSLSNWVMNSKTALLAPKGPLYYELGNDAKLHDGFTALVDSIWPALVERIEKFAATRKPGSKLYVTGHSLGGAEAQIAAWKIDQFLAHEKFDSQVNQVMTFAAPMIGNKAAVTSIENSFGNRLVKFVGENDFVPHLPAGSDYYSGRANVVFKKDVVIREYLTLEEYRGLDLKTRLVPDAGKATAQNMLATSAGHSMKDAYLPVIIDIMNTLAAK